MTFDIYVPYIDLYLMFVNMKSGLFISSKGNKAIAPIVIVLYCNLTNDCK